QFPNSVDYPTHRLGAWHARASDYDRAAPALGSGSSDCGTSPSIGGNDSAGRVTVGAATNGGRCTITFVSPWPNPPACSAFDETTGNLIPPAATSTTSVALTGTLTAGDCLVYQWLGYQSSR